jgi:hypothetical protein
LDFGAEHREYEKDDESAAQTALLKNSKEKPASGNTIEKLWFRC